MDINVKITIVDGWDTIDISNCMVEGHGQFFCNYSVTVSASYEYQNKFTNKGAQLVPIGMPTVC